MGTELRCTKWGSSRVWGGVTEAWLRRPVNKYSKGKPHMTSVDRRATTFVTGGAGTIGSTIVDQLLTAGVWRIRILDNLVRGRRANLAGALDDPRVELVVGDLRDIDLVHDMTKGSDLVFHEAAIRITQCAEEPRLALQVLVDGTFTVLEAAAEHKVDKVVAASSASVYGLAEEFPTTERHHHTTTTPFTVRRSRSTKACCAASGRCTGSNYVALRPFNVYGPRMDIHGVYTEVLIRWMERISSGQAPLIFGDGSQTMDFVNTVDIARAHLLAAYVGHREGVYNVASGTETSLADLARALLARWIRTCPSSTAPNERSTGSPGGWPRPRQPHVTLGFEPKSICTQVCVTSSPGGAPSNSTSRLAEPIAAGSGS